MGITRRIARSTFSDANALRLWRIYRELAMLLASRALASSDKDTTSSEIAEPVYALDSTTIDLYLSLFPSAKFRSHKDAIKMHTLMDIEASIPTFIGITEGHVHDVNVLDILPVEADSIYITGRDYVDFDGLYRMHTAGGRFVAGSKKDLQFYRKSSTPVEKATGLQCAQIIRLTGSKSKQDYPESLRRVHLITTDPYQDIVLLTQYNRSRCLPNCRLLQKLMADRAVF
jgi:hypothetical protein